MNQMHIPRKMLPKDLQDGVLEAISIQAIGQVFITQGLQIWLSFEFISQGLQNPDIWAASLIIFLGSSLLYQLLCVLIHVIASQVQTLDS